MYILVIKRKRKCSQDDAHKMEGVHVQIDSDMWFQHPLTDCWVWWWDNCNICMGILIYLHIAILRYITYFWHTNFQVKTNIEKYIRFEFTIT